MPFAMGENVGSYRIVAQLGQGGMATVYRAYHASLDRFVALKVLHAALKADPNFIARFQREAQIIARLEHPHIVPIYDFAEHKGEPYLVMKFIEGETLKGWLANRPVSSGDIVQIVMAVGSALTYAHEQGVLHRDIKPSNILIENTGTPYLADFGLARIASAGESTLSRDMLLGTPQYISPEQAQGDVPLTAATDIYSLGVVLYEVIAGRVPFNADTPYAILHGHIYSPLPLPSKVNPAVKPPVEQVLLKALAKDPADRYPSALALAEAFRAAVSGAGPINLVPAQSDEKSGSAALKTPFTLSRAALQGRASPPQRKPARPGLTLPLLSALAVIVLVAVVVLALVRLRSSAQIAALATTAPTTSTLSADYTPARTFTPTPTPTDTPIPTATAVRSATPTPTPRRSSILSGATRVAIRPGLRVRNFELLDPQRLAELSLEKARQYIAENPDDPLGYFAIGIILHTKERNTQAAWSSFIQGIELAGDDAELLIEVAGRFANVGRLLKNSTLAGELEAAQATLYAYAYAKGAAQNQKVRDAAGLWLYHYAAGARPDNAHAETLQRAATANKSALLYGAWGLAALRSGRGPDSERAMQQAARLDPRLPELQLIHGIIQREIGANARPIFQAVRRAPDAPKWVKDEAQKLLEG